MNIKLVEITVEKGKPITEKDWKEKKCKQPGCIQRVKFNEPIVIEGNTPFTIKYRVNHDRETFVY